MKGTIDQVVEDARGAKAETAEDEDDDSEAEGSQADGEES